MKFIFVRHGETEYNKLNKKLDWLDEPLNEVGLKQAKTGVGRFFKKVLLGHRPIRR